MTQTMSLFTNFNYIAILIIVSVSAIIDVRTTKIYNVITFPAAALGILVNFLTGGWTAALMAVAGWFVGAMLVVGPKMFKMDKMDQEGFGDAKLMAAIGAFLGPGGVLLVFFYYSLAYGCVSTFKMARAVPWKHFFKLFKIFGPENLAMAQESIDMDGVVKVAKSKIALGPPIAVGTLLAILFQQQTLAFLGFHSTQCFGLPMILPAFMSCVFFFL